MSYRKQQVNRAAQLLDRKAPGWEAKINPNILNLQSPTYCVLGQIYGHYGDAPLGLFTTPYTSNAFRPYWRREIRARMKALKYRYPKITALDLRRPPKTVPDQKVYIPVGWTINSPYQAPINQEFVEKIVSEFREEVLA